MDWFRLLLGTLRARAMFAQVLPRVNAGVVPITPHGLNRITSNRFERFKFRAFGDKRRGLCWNVVQ